MKFPDLPRYILLKLKENSLSGTFFRLGWFLFLYFIGRYIFRFLEFSSFFSEQFSFLHLPFFWFIDNISTGFMGLFYHNLSSNPEYIISINNNEVIQLGGGCTGLRPILRLTFILLLYPISWKTKSYLLPLSWFIILFAATIHYILLIPVAYHWPEYFSFSHNWLTMIIFYGFYFLTWFIWERIGYPKKKMIR